MSDPTSNDFIRELDAIISRAIIRLEQYEIHAANSQSEDAAWETVARMKTSITRLERMKLLAQRQKARSGEAN